jgi:hypothetical protein
MHSQIPSFGNWFAFQMHMNLPGKWQWHNDGGFRTLGASFMPYQYLYRTGLRFAVNKKWSAATGTAIFYTRSSTQKYNKEFGTEIRLWQELHAQFLLSPTVSFQNRFRAEQRWFSSTSVRSSYFGLRFRNRVGIIKQLSEKWGLQFNSEYMIQLENKKVLFNQFRLGASANYKISESAVLQSSYMWVKWPPSSQHIIIINFQKVFSLHGNKPGNQ